MKDLSLKILNAKIWINGQIIEGDIVSKNGKISKIGKETSHNKSADSIDAKGNLVIPGIVDLHVHFRAPGFTHKEDFYTGSKAAAAGGVTTVLDEPNNKPVTSNLETLKAKIKLVEGTSFVDYLFNVAVFSDHLDEIDKVAKYGVKSFTFFDEIGDGSTGLNNTGMLYESLMKVNQVDGLSLLNCRESDLVIHSMNKIKAERKNDLEDYNHHFPHVAESIGGAKRILLANKIGVKTHLREISTSETVDMIRKFKPYMNNITSEIRPDHLFLNIKNTSDLGSFAQQWTPIRTQHDNEALWNALNDGTVEIIASDHATHTIEEKKEGCDNIWDSPPGLPAIESMLPLLLTAVNVGRTNLNRIIESLCVNPSKRLGLFPQKGSISVGSDADLVIIDIKKKGIIQGADSFSKNKWTPFEGWKTIGLPLTTIVGGVPVFNEGEIITEAGSGRFIVN